MLSLGISSCQQKKTELVWTQNFYQVGAQSSPRVSDLNGDGTQDIVIGLGIAETAETEQGIVAIDGKTGEIIWELPSKATVVGSANFHDINEDGVDDVFIGGRNLVLKAIDGKTGNILWEFQNPDPSHPILQHVQFNFYNSTWVPDQNGNGYPELLTVNGGNWNAAPGEEKDREPGVLMLLDSKTGAVIAADTMPDGKESYMSPIAFSLQNEEQIYVLFGSGGETIEGSLFLGRLEHLLEQNLSQAKHISTGDGHGFIAPPSLGDLNGDGSLDIIAVSHDGKMIAWDANNDQTIWEQQWQGLESSNALALGYFNGDKVPDIFANFSKGTWPDYQTAHQYVIDGNNGEILEEDSLGCGTISSPIVYDLNDDGLDDVLLSITSYDCDFQYSEEALNPENIRNTLLVYQPSKGRTQIIDEGKNFKNRFSTPWLGDLDRDGYLDFVYVQCYNPNDLFRFGGLHIRRISSHIKLAKPVRWGGYLGTNGDGIFHTPKD